MLDSNVIENFHTLWIITESIKESYNKLRDLDINGKKNDPLFNQTQNALTSSLALEKDLYNRIPDDSKTLDALILYMFKEKGELNYNIELLLKDLILGSEEDLIKRRIYQKLSEKFALCINPRETTMDILRIEGMEKQTVKSYLNIRQTITTDFLNTLLAIINLYLAKSSNYDAKEGLFKIIYNCFFVNFLIESDALEHEMNINPILYFESLAMSSFYKVEKEVIFLLKMALMGEVPFKSLAYLLEDLPFKFLKSPLNYFISEIILRACVLFSFEDDMIEILDDFLTSDDNLEGEDKKYLRERWHQLKELFQKDKNIPQVILEIRL